MSSRRGHWEDVQFNELGRINSDFNKKNFTIKIMWIQRVQNELKILLKSKTDKNEFQYNSRSFNELECGFMKNILNVHLLELESRLI